MSTKRDGSDVVIWLRLPWGIATVVMGVADVILLPDRWIVGGIMLGCGGILIGSAVVDRRGKWLDGIVRWWGFALIALAIVAGIGIAAVIRRLV